MSAEALGKFIILLVGRMRVTWDAVRGLVRRGRRVREAVCKVELLENLACCWEGSKTRLGGIQTKKYAMSPGPLSQFSGRGIRVGNNCLLCWPAGHVRGEGGENWNHSSWYVRLPQTAAAGGITWLWGSLEKSGEKCSSKRVRAATDFKFRDSESLEQFNAQVWQLFCCPGWLSKWTIIRRLDCRQGVISAHRRGMRCSGRCKQQLVVEKS